MSRHHCKVATWVAVVRPGLMSRHGQRRGQRSGVATPPGGRDLDCPEWCRDTNLMSRHGASFMEVATWNDVATWLGAGCLGVSRQVHAQHARDMRATSLLCAQQRPRHGHCARSVRATWVLSVRTVHPTQFCDNALFRVTVWTLFMDTVQEHCS